MHGSVTIKCMFKIPTIGIIFSIERLVWNGGIQRLIPVPLDSIDTGLIAPSRAIMTVGLCALLHIKENIYFRFFC
jgi:hypothetical protein